MRSVTELVLAFALATIVAAVVAVAPRLAHAQTCHHGVVHDDAIVWETQTSAATLLSAPASLESIEGGTIEDGAIALDRSSATVRLRTRQPVEEVLRPPLVRGPQRITLATPGGEPVAFEPRLEGPLERHVGYVSSAGIDRSVRHWLDASCGQAAGIPLYVDAERPIELAGALSRPSERRQALLWLGGVLLLVASVGGAIAYRRLRDRAAVERADALLEERYRALDPSEP